MKIYLFFKNACWSLMRFLGVVVQIPYLMPWIRVDEPYEHYHRWRCEWWVLLHCWVRSIPSRRWYPWGEGSSRWWSWYRNSWELPHRDIYLPNSLKSLVEINKYIHYPYIWSFLSLQGRVPIDDLRHVLDLVHSDQSIRLIEHVVPKRYYDELSIPCPLLYVLRYHRYVPVIQSRIYFIHEVERCRFVVMKGENQR